MILVVEIIFLLVLLSLVIVFILSCWFSVKFKALVARGGSMYLPLYRGYAFGKEKMQRQEQYRHYLLGRKYEGEERAELRRYGRVGRRLIISIFCLIATAFATIVAYIILRSLA